MKGITKFIAYGLAMSFFTLILITSTFAIQIQLAYAQVNVNNTTDSNNIQNNVLITKILAKNLENRLQKAGAILEVTSKLPQVRNVSYAHLLNQTLNILHGIPRDADIEKRQVAKNIIDSNSGLYKVFFIMPNGDMSPFPHNKH